MAAKQIEAVINEVLRDDAQKHALDFVAYLRENGIQPDEAEGYWELQYEGKSLCFLFINGDAQAPGPWTIWSNQEPGTWATWSDEGDTSAPMDAPVDEHTKEVAWAHVNFCASCGGDCSPGKRKTVLGKTFDNLCNSTMAFTDPDAEALACAKQMIAMRKNDILQGI